MNEKTILLKNIKPNDWNPNEMSQEQFAELVREVRHLGKPPKPIVLRIKGNGYQIVDGEHSYRALKELGIEVLQEGWFEIVHYDELEAKRQTWKRNLGGKNNPVKAGLMFAKALEESEMSNRQLADTLDISEATIRAYLLYAEASKLRGDLANLAQLTNEQVRLYVKIAEISKVIADFWLTCGGLDDGLIWFGETTFKDSLKANPDILNKILNSFQKIVKEGLEKKITYKNDSIPFNLTKEERQKYIQKFKNEIKRANRMADIRESMFAHFNWSKEGWAEETVQSKVNEYLELYFNSPLASNAPRDWMDTLFSTVIKKVDNKLEFMLTPDELKQCMELEGNQGYRTLLDKAKLLIANKHHIAPSDIKEDYRTLDQQLDQIEVDIKAPDYMKDKDYWGLPRKLKLAFLEIKIEDKELQKARWEYIVKKYRLKEFRDIDYTDKSKFKERIEKFLYEEDVKERGQKESEALRQKSEIELATLFMEKIQMLFLGSDADKKEIIEKMAGTFTKEFLYLFYSLANRYCEEDRWKQQWKSLGLELKKLG